MNKLMIVGFLVLVLMAGYGSLNAGTLSLEEMANIRAGYSGNEKCLSNGGFCGVGFTCYNYVPPQRGVRVWYSYSLQRSGMTYGLCGSSGQFSADCWWRNCITMCGEFRRYLLPDCMGDDLGCAGIETACCGQLLNGCMCLLSTGN